MQTATEIFSALKNLHYYSEQISNLARKQFELDCQRGQEIGINTGPGSIRFDSLGAIGNACGWINCYTDNITQNLHSAISQDKLLHTEEESQDALL